MSQYFGEKKTTRAATRIFAVTATMVSLVGSPLRVYAATSADITDLQDQLSTTTDDITAMQAKIKADAKQISDIQAHRITFPGDDCSKGCFDGCDKSTREKYLDESVASAYDTDTPYCEAIYKGMVAAGETVPNYTACSNAVTKCGSVKAEIQILALQQDESDSQKQLKQDQKDRDKIQAKLDDAKANCPQCNQQQSNSGQPQLNGWQDAALMIGAITPMALGGLGAYEYGKGLNSYSQNYQSYLQQCATIGIPCQGPSGFGGGFGDGGMFGYGGLGGIGGGGGYGAGFVGMPYSGMGYGGMPYSGAPFVNAVGILGGGGMPYAGMPYGGMPYGGMPYMGTPYASGVGIAGMPYMGTPYAS